LFAVSFVPEKPAALPRLASGGRVVMLICVIFTCVLTHLVLRTVKVDDFNRTT
jgi:hypothetical protein